MYIRLLFKFEKGLKIRKTIHMTRESKITIIYPHFEQPNIYINNRDRLFLCKTREHLLLFFILFFSPFNS